MKEFGQYRLGKSILHNHIRISIRGEHFQMLRIGDLGLIALHYDPYLVAGVDEFDEM